MPAKYASKKVLIVGLGNPGDKYRQTRHNLGFMALDALTDLLRTDGEELIFKLQKKFQAEVAEIKTAGQKIILAKPQTFMNQSGAAVAALVNFHKLSPADVWLIHDDLDLALGQFKIQTNRSAAGHNGVQSIFEALSTQEVARWRIGLAGTKRPEQNGADFVLGRLTKKELTELKSVLPTVAASLKTALVRGMTAAMNQYNR